MSANDLPGIAELRDAMRAAGFTWVPLYSPGAQHMTKDGMRVATGKEPVGGGWQRGEMRERVANNTANTGPPECAPLVRPSPPPPPP